jgi:hypothetical protein
LYGEDLNDEAWVDRKSEDFNLPALLTKDEKRYATQAETNVVRKKMGYKPKTNASVDSPEYKRIERVAKQDAARERFIPNLMREVAEVIRDLQSANAPLGEWDETDCTTLVRRWFAFERWQNEFLELGGHNYVPSVPPLRDRGGLEPPASVC